MPTCIAGASATWEMIATCVSQRYPFAGLSLDYVRAWFATGIDKREHRNLLSLRLVSEFRASLKAATVYFI